MVYVNFDVSFSFQQLHQHVRCAQQNASHFSLCTMIETYTHSIRAQSRTLTSASAHTDNFINMHAHNACYFVSLSINDSIILLSVRGKYD